MPSSFRPHTLVYHDCIMKSLTLLPPPNTSILTPNRVSNELQNLKELCPTKFVVLVRRKKEHAVNLPQIQIKKWAMHPDPFLRVRSPFPYESFVTATL